MHSPHRLTSSFLVVSFAAISVAACSADDPATSPTAPTPPPTEAPAPAPAPTPLPAPATGLPPGITEIASLDPTNDDADLAGFDAAVGTTEIIGLGETVHTSGGYHRIRARLVRHMIEKLGFRAVGLETPWADALAATRYVETCTGTPLEAARSIFGVFASVQMADLFGWMCQWNQAHPSDKVSFWGYDIQDPWAQATRLRDFVGRAAPAKAAVVRALDACIGAKFTSAAEAFADPDTIAQLTLKKPISKAEYEACEAAVQGARDWLTADRASLSAATSADEVRWMSLSVDAIQANEREYYFFQDEKTSFEARDTAMARTLMASRELRSPGKRVVVIAHNTHLAHAQSKIGGYYEGVRAMGQMLKEDHKAPYEAIGLLASTVKINWGDFEDPPVADAKADAELRLHSLGKASLFVDLAKSTFLEPAKSYSIAGESCVPREQFRGLVYLDESEAMVYAK